MSPSLSIPPEELRWRFSASGGPGGQHANTSHTRVELLFDVEASTSLGPRQRQRIMARLGPRIRVTAADERSQARNRELALERLKEKLAAALRRDKPRLPTLPSAAARRRRLEQKRRRGELKKARRPPTEY